MEVTIKKLKEHKYLIIFMCMLLQAIPFGVSQNIMPLFISYVIKGQGFSLGGIFINIYNRSTCVSYMFS